jgi:hypothetical protein
MEGFSSVEGGDAERGGGQDPCRQRRKCLGQVRIRISLSFGLVGMEVLVV